MTRFAAIAAAVVVLAGGGGAAGAQEGEEATSRVQRWLEDRLSTAVQGEVRFGTFSWSLTRLTAEVTQLRLVIPVRGAPSLTASAASGRIRLVWSGLAGLFGGRVQIAEIVLDAPEFETTAATVEGMARRRTPRAPVEVSVERLVVREGRLRYRNADDGLDVVLSGLSYDGSWDAYRRVLDGHVKTEGGVVRPPIVKVLPFSAEGSLRVSPRTLEFVGIEGTTEGLQATIDGRLLLRGQVAFSAEARARGSLATLGRYLDPKFPDLEGSAETTLRIDKGGPGFTVLGHAVASRARFGPLRAESAAADFSVRPGLLEIRALDAQAYGGRARGEIDVTLEEPVLFRTRIFGSGLDAESILALAQVRLPISASADGSFDVEGEPGEPASWEGSARFTARPGLPNAGRVPAAAEGKLVFGDGHARLAGAVTELAAARLGLDLDADLAKSPVTARLALHGTTDDATVTQTATMTFMETLGVEPPDLAREHLAGRGKIAAAIVVGETPGFDLDLDLSGGAWSGEPFDRAAFVLRYDGATVAIDKLEASRGDEMLDARLRLDGDGNILDIEVRTVGLAFSSVMKRAEIDVDLTGRLDSDFRAARREGKLSGAGRFALRDAEVLGERVDEASGPVRLDAGVAHIAPINLRGPALTAIATVEIALESQTVSGMIETAEILPGGLALLEKTGLTADGTLRLSGAFGWTPEGPEGLLQVEGSGVDVGKAGPSVARVTPGEIAGSLKLAPDGALFDLRAGAGDAWEARGRLGWSAEAPLDATIKLRDASLGLTTTRSGSVDLGFTTELIVTGPLGRPEDLFVEGELERVTVRLGPRVLESEASASLLFASGRLEVGSMVLRDASSTLRTKFAFVPETGVVEADATGTLDLGVLNTLVPGMRASGTAEFTASARGKADDPVLNGRFSVKGARVRIPGFPQPLDEVVLEVRLEDSRADVERFEAQCGGGVLRGEGSLLFAQQEIASYAGRLDVARVGLSLPEGFRGVYDGRLNLEGSSRLGRLTGRLAMIRGLYGEDIDVLSLFAATSRQVLPDDESVLPRTVNLEISIVADGNVWMRNNLGRVETRVDLMVGGTAARPEFTGRLELFEDGMFRFRDVEYRIEKGTIELADPRTILPLIDLRGTTRVKDVEIDLHLEGPIDKIRYELTSNPPLTEQDIIGLLLTGRTFEDVASLGGAAGFTGDIAANYFAGALTARLGRQLGEVLGLDRLQIDPLVVENGGDATTRITVGKQLGARLGVLYSTTLGATKDENYQLDWDISRRLQFVGETGTDEGVGGDLRYRNRYGGDPNEGGRRRPSRGAAEGARVASVVVTGVPFPMAEKLTSSLPLEAGSRYSRSALYEGSEIVRHALAKEGRIEARVETRVVTAAPDGSDEAATDVVYEVDLGPQVSVRIEGSGWRDRMRQAKKLQSFWESSLFSSDLYMEGEEILRRDAELRGYFAADVYHERLSTGAESHDVTFVVDRGEEVRLKAIRIVGSEGVPEERIRAQMLTRAGGFSFGRRVLDRVVLEEDVRAIRVLYRNEGYLGVKIDGPIVRLSPRANEATVTLRIDEGRRWIVGRVDAPTNLPVSAATLRAWSKLVPGRVFSPAAVLEAENAIRTNLDRAGYPDAAVEAAYELVDDAANVSLEVTVGPLQKVGRVEISGRRRTKERIIRREIGFSPGDPVSRDVFRETQQKLYRLGIFRDVRIETSPAEEDDPTLRTVTVKVNEAAPIGMSLGPGYNSDTGARLSFALSHENVGGYDRSVALFGRWSDPEKRIQIVGREPRLFNRRLTGLASFFWEKAEQTGFTIERRSVAVRAERKVSARLSRFLRYNFQRVDVTPDPTITIEQIGDLLRQRLTNVRLGDLGIAIVRDTRDDPFLTTRGGYASVEFRFFAKPFVSDETFAKLSLGGSLTRTFPRGASLSLAMRVGASKPMGATLSVPISERFFAGGESTVRGFRRDELGPSFSDLTGVGGLEDVPVGGEGLLVVNEEWRFPLWRGLRGVLFVDAGNVFYAIDDFTWGGLRESAGLGLRYDTPIGPLRVEYGWKLDRRAGESPGELHLAIGSVF